MEKLLEEGTDSVNASGSTKPHGKFGHWEDGAVSTSSSNEVGGGYIM